MTKYLDYAFLSAALLAILPACTSTSSEPEEPASATEVKFAAVENTRATVTTGTTIKNAPFVVYGDMVMTSSSNNPTVIFNGTEVAHDGTSWKYTDTQYWFPSHTYSFVAIHPANAFAATDIDYSNGTLSFSYTLPSDYTQTVDILSATHRRRYTSGKADAVAFNFNHILSRINFIANIDNTLEETTSVVITGFRLRNVSNSADYSIMPAPLTTGTQTDDMAGDCWTNLSDPTAELFNLNYGGAPITLGAGGKHEFFPIENNHALCVIPQMLSSELIIELDYYTIENGVEQDPKHTIGNLYSIAMQTHGGRWAMGESYTYSFSIGVEGRIIFSAPSVQSWNEAEGASYIIMD